MCGEHYEQNYIEAARSFFSDNKHFEKFYVAGVQQLDSNPPVREVGGIWTVVKTQVCVCGVCEDFLKSGDGARYPCWCVRRVVEGYSLARLQEGPLVSLQRIQDHHDL